MEREVVLTGRSILTLHDLADEEFAYLIELSGELKRRKRSGVRGRLLERKNIAMLFEKMSTRTRCAAGVAHRARRHPRHP